MTEQQARLHVQPGREARGGLGQETTRLLAGPLGFRQPLRRFVAVYFVGMFFSLALPTSVGGDVVRAWYLDGRSGRRKVSLRATDGEVDVSVIARQFGGGGHRQAAGFTTDVPLDDLIERLRSEISAQL